MSARQKRTLQGRDCDSTASLCLGCNVGAAPHLGAKEVALHQAVQPAQQRLPALLHACKHTYQRSVSDTLKREGGRWGVRRTPRPALRLAQLRRCLEISGSSFVSFPASAHSTDGFERGAPVARSARKIMPAQVPHTGRASAQKARRSGIRPHLSATLAIVVLSPPVVRRTPSSAAAVTSSQQHADSRATVVTTAATIDAAAV